MSGRDDVGLRGWTAIERRRPELIKDCQQTAERTSQGYFIPTGVLVEQRSTLAICPKAASTA